MKRKTVKIMAMLLAATMMLGTVTVGAEELEVVESESISVDEDASVQELSVDEDVLVENPSFAEDTNNEAISDDGSFAVFGSFADEAEMIDDSEAAGASDTAVDKPNGAKKINNKAKKVFEKMGGKKKSYMYKKLSKAEKKIYDYIDKEVSRLLYKGGETRKIKGKGSDRYTKEFYTEKFKTGGKQADKFYKVFDIYMLDNPQAFLLGYKDQGVRKRTFFCQASINEDMKTAARIKDRAEEIAKNIDADAKIIKKQSGDYNKVYKILEILCNRLEQGNGHLYGFSGLHTTYYKKRKVGNDSSYATAFVALARVAGLEAYHVCGNKGDWVRVKVKGNWYNVDPKKCDNKIIDPDDFKRGFSLQFFLKNDADINSDKEHVVNSDFKKYYPKTNKTSYNLPKK